MLGTMPGIPIKLSCALACAPGAYQAYYCNFNAVLSTCPLSKSTSRT
jgi:hypothetical protein